MEQKILNAENRTVGRVASEAASLIMGKKTPKFVKNANVGSAVKIVNASKIRISGTKAKNKIYKHYTGHPGGLKGESYAMLKERKGAEEILRLAVYGMLPGNRLRPSRMKMLTIEE
jgi:large subunit ribosomal protein L13